MSADSLSIATMAPADVEFAIGLAAAEGWNPGLHDAATFRAADPEGFLVARLGEEPVGCIAAVRYPEDFGFIGLYIVVPGRRGRGFGIALWRRAIERLAGCNIGLDGVLAQQENYRRSGFRLAYRNVRFERSGPVDGERIDPGVVPLRAVPFAAISGYDRTAFPSSREPFLRAWLAQPESIGYAALAGGRVAGYGVMRRCRSGSKIGPLFADDAVCAERLFAALCRLLRGDEPVYLDVPEVNAEAMALARRHGMREVFGTARMYTGASPRIDLARVFGVTTFELG